ncbi:MAG: cyanophycinase [Bacteroidetes bacterium]|nr:MAG: cyanophycinase [Bacteroidota bacterium]RLD85944.1 MAG: cyanophycinase [Bacteroidota bacterium]
MKLQLFFLILIITYSGYGQNDQNGRTTGPEKGSLVIVGGNLSDSSIYAKFMELAGGSDAPVVIIPTAGDDEFLFKHHGLEEIEKRFADHGFRNLTILHTRNREEANKKEFYEPLEKATGIWFSGGRQWRLVDAYQHTKTYDLFFKVLEKGGVIGGSSAGASIQASFLVRGDTKTNVVMMGDHQEGFGFITQCAIDQHLLALNRQFDIYEILEAHPGLLGIGLDENTAIVVHGNEFEVIGESYVAIYDGTFCHFIRDKNDWSVERPEIIKNPEGSERFYLLGAGRRYNLTERKVIE